MTHVQIDDAFFDHPKVLSVSKDAKILAVAAICYCGNMLTDGFIPHGAIAVLGAKTGVAKTKAAIDELVTSRLWEVVDGGYAAHDYLDYNSSAEKVQANRDATRERMRKLRSPNVRTNNDQTTHKHQSKFDECAPNVRDSTTTTTTTGSYEPNGSSEPEDGQKPEIPIDPPSPPVVRETRIPDDFVVDDDMTRWAESKGFSQPEIDHHTEAFVSHWRGEGGPKARKRDWKQAWQTWLLREKPGRWPGALLPSRNGTYTNGKVSTNDHAGEDREYLRRGLPPVWGSANGGIDSL